MSPPARKHQRIIGEIFAVIREYINTHNGPCEVDISPFAVFLDKDDANYVEPDISVICDPNKLTDKGCFGAPDWIIEIVSPSSRRMDYFTKLFKYRAAGVREYWIVEPDKKSMCYGLLMSDSAFCYLAALLNERMEVYWEPPH